MKYLVREGEDLYPAAQDRDPGVAPGKKSRAAALAESRTAPGGPLKKIRRLGWTSRRRPGTQYPAERAAFRPASIPNTRGGVLPEPPAYPRPPHWAVPWTSPAA